MRSSERSSAPVGSVVTTVRSVVSARPAWWPSPAPGTARTRLRLRATRIDRERRLALHRCATQRRELGRTGEGAAGPREREHRGIAAARRECEPGEGHRRQTIERRRRRARGRIDGHAAHELHAHARAEVVARGIQQHPGELIAAAPGGEVGPPREPTDGWRVDLHRADLRPRRAARRREIRGAELLGGAAGEIPAGSRTRAQRRALRQTHRDAPCRALRRRGRRRGHPHGGRERTRLPGRARGRELDGGVELQSVTAGGHDRARRLHARTLRRAQIAADHFARAGRRIDQEPGPIEDQSKLLLVELHAADVRRHFADHVDAVVGAQPDLGECGDRPDRDRPTFTGTRTNSPAMLSGVGASVSDTLPPNSPGRLP